MLGDSQHRHRSSERAADEWTTSGPFTRRGNYRLASSRVNFGAARVVRRQLSEDVMRKSRM
jgi:hypothetical protein